MTTDLEWAMHADLNQIQTLGAAKLMVRYLREELERYRTSVTTGGPPAPFTPGWRPGDSSRPPTAPPVDEVVQLPE